MAERNAPNPASLRNLADAIMLEAAHAVRVKRLRLDAATARAERLGVIHAVFVHNGMVRMDWTAYVTHPVTGPAYAEVA